MSRHTRQTLAALSACTEVTAVANAVKGFSSATSSKCG